MGLLFFDISYVYGELTEVDIKWDTKSRIPLDKVIWLVENNLQKEYIFCYVTPKEYVDLVPNRYLSLCGNIVNNEKNDENENTRETFLNFKFNNDEEKNYQDVLGEKKDFIQRKKKSWITKG